MSDQVVPDLPIAGTYNDVSGADHGAENDDHIALAGESAKPVEASTASSLARVGRWLETCQKTHTKCSVQYEYWVPSRVIYVRGNSEDPVRLCQRSSVPHGAPYATLSHCWGGVHTLNLTSTTMEAFLEGIAMTDLPATYKDAVSIARSLGIAYLWIDSLCIIQDSAEDWQRESGDMCKVYKHGLVNIATLHAENSHGGCFAPRNPRQTQPITVQSRWSICRDRLWTMMPMQNHEFTDSKLHRRAWVVQERALAPRVLSFGKRMVHWRCLERTTTDYEPHRFGEPWHIQISDRDIDATGKTDAILTKWHTLVSEFTASGLSFEKDKLVAFAGIAKELQKVLEKTTGTPWKYLAGLWEPLFPMILLWERTNVSRPERVVPRRPEHYRAPSWSWAATEGDVLTSYFGWPGPHNPAKGFEAEVIEAEVALVGEDPFLQISGGHLKVDCELLLLDMQAQVETDLQAPGLILVWDVPADAHKRDTAVYFMPVSVRFDDAWALQPAQVMLHGLMLEATGSEYRRLGTCRIRHKKDADVFRGLQGEEVTIWYLAIIQASLEQNMLVVYPDSRMKQQIMLI